MNGTLQRDPLTRHPKQRWAIGAACGLICLLAASHTACPALTINVGDLRVSFDPDLCWIAGEIRMDGSTYSGWPGAGQGTVMAVDFTLVGSVHGNEQLLTASLDVDGRSRPLDEAGEYTCNRAQLRRTTVLGGAYQLTSVMTLTPEGTNENITLVGLDPQKNVNLCYGFLGSRVNRLAEYAAYDDAGNLLQTGQTDADDLTKAVLGDAVGVAQYDPAAENGIVSVVTIGGELGLDQFIWDTDFSNKLYAILEDIEGPAARTKRFTINQRIRFFDAPQESWESTAGGIAARQFVFIPGDTDLDEAVDDGDLSRLMANWGREAVWTTGDFNNDGIADDGDLNLLLTNWDGKCGASIGDLNGDGYADDDDLSLFLTYWTISREELKADFNGDRYVDDVDLSLLLTNWYATGEQHQGDLNGDGCVSGDDLSIFLTAWGTGMKGNPGDLNTDGNIDDIDLSLLLSSWNPGPSPLDGDSVPEPAALSLMIAVGLGLTVHKR